METTPQENNEISYPLQDGYDTPICFNHGVQISQNVSRSTYNHTTMTREAIAEMDDSDWNEEFALDYESSWDYFDVDYSDIEVDEKSISKSHHLFGPDDLDEDLNNDVSADLLWTIQVGPWDADRIPFAEYLERMGLTSNEAFKELFPDDPEKVESYEAAWNTQAPTSKPLPTMSVDRNITELPDELRDELLSHLQSFATILVPDLDFDDAENKLSKDYLLRHLVVLCRGFFDEGAMVIKQPENVPLHLVEKETDGVENGMG